ncbi:MAG: hypothetical protein ACKOWE_02795 [Micrococcales bacterium]
MTEKYSLIEFAQNNLRRGQLTQAVLGIDFAAGLEIASKSWLVIPYSQLAQVELKTVAGLPELLRREEDLESHLARLIGSEVRVEQSSACTLAGKLDAVDKHLIWLKTPTSRLATSLHSLQSLALWKTPIEECSSV